MRQFTKPLKAFLCIFTLSLLAMPVGVMGNNAILFEHEPQAYDEYYEEAGGTNFEVWEDPDGIEPPLVIVTPQPTPPPVLRNVTVSFFHNNDADNVTNRNVVVGSPIGSLPGPGTRAGHTFNRWQTGNGQTVTSSTVIHGDTFVEAIWTPVGGGGGGAVQPNRDILVTFIHLNNADHITQVWIQSGATLGPLMPNPGQRTSHTFSRWTLDGRNFTIDSATKIWEDTTVVAVWNQNASVQPTPVLHHSLSLNLNGGNLNNSDRNRQFNIQHCHSVNNMGLRLPQPVRSGYTFLGWDMPNGQQFNSNTLIYNSMTLTARWSQPQNVNVTFTLGGGTLNNNTTNRTITLSSGQSFNTSNLAMPGNPTRAGYTFGNWRITSSGQLFNSNTVVTQSITVEAVWNPINTFTVTFDPEGGLINNSPNKIHFSVVGGQSMSSSNHAIPSTPVRVGFNFNGWVMPSGQPFTATTPIHSSFEVDATWTPIQLPTAVVPPVLPIQTTIQPIVTEQVQLDTVTGNVYIGGNHIYIPTDLGAFHINARGVAVLPARASLAVLFNANPFDPELFYWDAASNTLSIDEDGRNIDITIGSTTMYVNGVPRTILSGEGASAMPFAAYIDPDDTRMYLPVRALAESLGFVVGWDAASGRVILTPPSI